ncbi:MAG: hypothetical protein AAGB93_11880 [Planctomycetota bacterium]
MTALLRIALVALVLTAAPLRVVAACWSVDACCVTHCDDVEPTACCGVAPADQEDAPGEEDDDPCGCCELPLAFVEPPFPPPLVHPPAVPAAEPPRSLCGVHPEPGVPPPIGRSA